MASNRIKGITIEIGGETVGLQNALKDVNKRSRDLQQELKDVEKLLKFDPGNAEAAAQKQKLLAEQVQNTSDKLNILKDAQAEVDKQFQSGAINEKQFRSFRREVEFTEGELKKLQQALKEVDDGNGPTNAKKDLSKLGDAADDAKGAVNDLGGELAGLAGGLAAGGGIAGAFEKALDLSSVNTKIELSMEIDEDSKQIVLDTVNTVKSYGIDAEAALEGVRRQWALNKNSTDEANQAVVDGAATIASTYAGIDFTELIQEANEISSELNMSNQNALGLVNALLKMGFPPEQIDIVAEYGKQLHDAGYNAAEIQAIFAAGIETGTWNIDNLLDGIKEGRIKMAEFGQEVPKALSELLAGTEISKKQMQDWGKAVAEGGSGGSQAMRDVATALLGIDDETKRNALGVQIFGTIWEDQGQNIIDTLLNAKDKTVDLKEQQDQLNESTSKLNSDPAVQMQQALTDLKTALTPLLLAISAVVSKIAEWVSENPNLAATIAAVASAIGILLGIAMGLAPIFVALQAASVAFGIGLAPLIGIAAAVVAGIAALIAIGVLLYKNWDTVKAKAAEIWNAIQNTFNTVTTAIAEYIRTNFGDGVYGAVMTYMNMAKEIISSVLNFWKGTFSNVLAFLKSLVTGDFEGMKNAISNQMQLAKSTIVNILGAVSEFFSSILGKISGYVKENFSGIYKAVSSYLDMAKNIISSVLGFWKTTFSNALSFIKSLVTGDFEGMKKAISDQMENAKNTIEDIWGAVEEFFANIDLVQIGKDIIQGLIDGIGSMAGGLMEKAAGIAKSIKDTLTDAFDINSPSRYMRDMIGKNIGKGLIMGLDSMRNSISQASQRMTEAAMPQVRNVRVPTAATMNSGSPQPIILQTVLQDGRVIAEATYPDINKMLYSDMILSAKTGGTWRK